VLGRRLVASRTRLIGSCQALLLVTLIAAILAPGPAFAAGKSRSLPLVPAGAPALVSITRIGVRAPLERISGTSPHDSEAPYRWNDAAWYSRDARPGDLGHAIIFGHLDSTCCPAVFWNLPLLHSGDVVQVSYPNGRILSFRIMWSHSYWNNQLPMNWIFSRGRQRGLIMWTCSGVFHTDGTGYDHKLIVYARMVMPGGRLG
jgi:Sortase domain